MGELAFSEGEKRRGHVMNRIIAFVMSLMCLLLLAGVVLGTSSGADHTAVQEISGWTMETKTGIQEVALPSTLESSSGSFPVILTAKIPAGAGGCLYLKTVYTPVEVYADGVQIFAYGQEGTYPAFLLDPPTMVRILQLPKTGEPVTLKLRYGPSTQRSHATIYPVLLGEPDELLKYLFSRMGFSLFFSIILMALGGILGLIALFLAQFEKVGISILWLGLFSFLVGIWIFGECNLTGIFIQNPPLLYLMAFLGMFTMAVPLIRCGAVILSPHHPKLLMYTCMVLELAVAGAVFLQLLGIAALSRTMYLFHVLIPSVFLIFAGYVLLEAFYYRNRFAALFLFPVSVLAVFSILEAVNYYLHMLPVQISFFFQVGVLTFTGTMCVLCGFFVRYSFLAHAKNRQLSYELSLMEIQTEARKKQYAILSETAASIKAQRHDLRHHLAVIRRYQEQHMDQKLSEYLNALSANIPVDTEERLCENDAVDAVARYYLSMAQKTGLTSVSLALHIPSDTGQVQETDLCIIIGNLLENAVTACRGREHSFLRMQSRIQYGIMTITMDNSCPLVCKNPDGSFRSRKTGGGSGLASIRSAAEKYGGGARFEEREHTFCSSVYLYLNQNQEDSAKPSAKA